MSEEIAKLADNPEFLEFLNKQFNDVAANATMEELAEFAFGGMEDAIEAFRKFQEVQE